MQGRLLVWVLGTVTAAWLAAAAFTWVDVRHELDELLDGHLAQAAALLVVQQAHEIDDDERSEAPTLHRYAPKVAFQVWHKGELVARSANAPTQPMAEQRSGFASPTIDGERWRVFAARGAKQRTQVYVGEQLASRESILAALLRGLVAPMLLALPAIALLLWWAVRRGLLPLRTVALLLHLLL